jgi:hypothetical protein
MRGLLIEVIDGLDAVDDTDRFPPMCIFAEGGSGATPDARAIVCPGDNEGSFFCPQAPALTYVLEVDLAKTCVAGWSECRGGRRPTPQDKFAAVMHYSRNDSWLPLE